MTQRSTPHEPIENTELEGRLLAHERILKSLIAYMSRTQPRLLDHLSKTIVQQAGKVPSEYDQPDGDDYAEQFIRAVAALGDAETVRKPAALGPLHPRINARNDATLVSVPPLTNDRIQTSKRNGIWTVTVDGVFRGDYYERAQAEAAAAVARLGID